MRWLAETENLPRDIYMNTQNIKIAKESISFKESQKYLQIIWLTGITLDKSRSYPYYDSKRPMEENEIFARVDVNYENQLHNIQLCSFRSLKIGDEFMELPGVSY